MDLSPFLNECRATAERLGARVTDGSNVVRIRDRTRLRYDHTQKFFDWCKAASIQARETDDEALREFIGRQLDLFSEFVREEKR